MIKKSCLALLLCYAYGFAAENDNWLSQYVMQPGVVLEKRHHDLIGNALSIPTDTDVFADVKIHSNPVTGSNMLRFRFPEAITQNNVHLARYWPIMVKVLMFMEDEYIAEEEKTKLRQSLVGMQRQRALLSRVLPDSYQAIESVAKNLKELLEEKRVNRVLFNGYVEGWEQCLMQYNSHSEELCDEEMQDDRLSWHHQFFVQDDEIDIEAESQRKQDQALLAIRKKKVDDLIGVLHQLMED